MFVVVLYQCISSKGTRKKMNFHSDDEDQDVDEVFFSFRKLGTPFHFRFVIYFASGFKPTDMITFSFCLAKINKFQQSYLHFFRQIFLLQHFYYLNN